MRANQLIWLIFALWTNPLQAVLSCSYGFTNINFGSVNLLSNNTVQTQGNFSISCSNGVAGKRIRICSNLLSGGGGSASSGDPRYLSNGTSTIAFNIFADPGYQVIWGSQTDALPTNPLQVDLVLDSNGTGFVNVPIYAKIYPNQSLAPTGLYQSLFDGNSSFINFKQSPLPSDTCKEVSASGIQQSAPFTVSLNSMGGCNLTTSGSIALDFGTVSIGSPTLGQGSFSAQCSPGIAYQIGLDGGMYSSKNSSKRALKNQTGQVLFYELYRDSQRTLPWGNTLNTDTLSSNGTGLVQSFPVYGLLPWQPDLSSGNYNDTVQVLLYY